ncbi:hypothetical protein H6G27_26495 [Nostoc linckia FACHB-104]|nr:hypothetical protein [Nostoc linckia FACHB-104]
MNTITKDNLTQTTAGNQITITLDRKQETLPEPTKATETDLGTIAFRSLLACFSSALVTQVVLLLPVPALTEQRLLSAVVGTSIFVLGMQATVKKQVQPANVISLSAVVAGVLLGS